MTIVNTTVQETNQIIYNYLNKLELLSQKYPVFNNGGLLEFVSNISEDEKKAVLYIDKFYEYLKLLFNDNKPFFEIKYNDRFYQIGYFETFDFIYYCNVIEESNMYYDFNNLEIKKEIILNRERV